MSRMPLREGTVRALWIALAVALLARLLTLGAYPLFDETESRYAEIARQMLARHDWVTLWYVDRVPFWAKPPLSTWLSAASMGLFGLNEFAARLPSLACGVATLVAAGAWARSIGGARAGLLAAVMLAGSVGFFVDAGAVMTDPALVACVAIAQWAGWRAVAAADTRAAARATLAAFAVAGAGLLVKGPVVALLGLVPAALSLLLAGRRGVRPPLAAVVAGIVLMLAIAAPWYWAAEVRTPGFLSYFLIGEHFGRFAQPGWRGDLYGHPKQAVRGAVWLYALLAAMPWPLALLWRDARVAASGLVRRVGSDPAVRYAAVCALLPLGLFTLSRNVMWTYALPATPALAVLASLAALRIGQRPGSAGPAGHGGGSRRIAAAGGACALVVAAALVAASRSDRLPTSRPLVEAWHAQPESAAMPLVFAEHRPYSANFYLHGHTVWVRTDGALVLLLSDDATLRCAAFPSAEWDSVDAAARARLRVRWSNARWRLACRDGPPGAAAP